MKAALAAATLLLAAVVTGALLLPAGGPSFVTGSVFLGRNPAPQPVERVGAGALCNTDGASVDRTPDAAIGPQVHVIYAFPADGQDRYASVAPAIAADLVAIDGWWKRQDPTRSIRFDLFASPGCAPGLDQLDITRVQLSQPTSYYYALDSRASRLIDEVGRQFGDTSKKYLLYYDAAVDEPRLCGQSSLNPERGGRYAYAVIYAQTCHADIGAGVITATVAAHELAHNLGAVPLNAAPHACSGDTAHVCDDENDLLFPYTRGQGLNALSLDAGHDDYYAHSGGWWDLQDSAWLAPTRQQFPLTVTVGGTGSGTVTSKVGGISCPSSCAANWDQGAQVELSAVADSGARFAGWSGGCTADPCVVTMSAAQTVSATFYAVDPVTVTLQRVGRSGGTVRSVPAGITCPGKCEATYDRGTRVRLIASVPKNSAFSGWTGGCAGKAACSVVAGSRSSVVATFGPAPVLRPPAPKCKAGQRPTAKKTCRP